MAPSVLLFDVVCFWTGRCWTLTSGHGSTWQSLIAQWLSSGQNGHGRFRFTCEYTPLSLYAVFKTTQKKQQHTDCFWTWQHHSSKTKLKTWKARTDVTIAEVSVCHFWCTKKLKVWFVWTAGWILRVTSANISDIMLTMFNTCMTHITVIHQLLHIHDHLKTKICLLSLIYFFYAKQYSILYIQHSLYINVWLLLSIQMVTCVGWSQIFDE